MCHREVEDDGEAYPHLLDVGAPKARRSVARSGAAAVSGAAPKEVPPPTLSVEALPARMVFPVGKSPTDAEAQALGFPTAKEWYVQTSTAFRHGQPAVRPALEAEFRALRVPEEPGADPEPDQSALDDEPEAREPSEADELMKLGGEPLSRPPSAGGRGRDDSGDVGIWDSGFPDDSVWDDAVLADAGDVPLVPGGLRPW